MDARDHVGTEKLRDLSWLSIPDRVRYFKLCHVFRVRYGLAPGYLSLNFTPITDRHSHFTRGSSFNYVISPEFSNAPSSFAFTSIKEWNALPGDIKSIQSFPIFRRKLKQFLMLNY